MSNKVYVLDYDLVSSIGIGKEEVFKNLSNNYLAGKEISNFQTDGMTLNIAAEINNDLSPIYTNENDKVKSAIYYDRKFELVVSAYNLMKDRLQNLLSKTSPDRAGVILGIGLDVIPFELLDPTLNKFSDDPSTAYLNAVDHLNKETSSINTVLNPLDLSGLFLANKLGLGAFQRNTLTACTASTQAIALAAGSIRSGESDMVVTGGTDSILNMMSYTAFSKLRVILPNDRTPEKTCLPFDSGRNGTLVGEAAGLIVLANEETVSKLGIEPKFEIIGYGNTLDGYKITSPDPTAIGMTRAMKNVLTDANIKPSEVDYINLHGTGTYANDPLELKALQETFGSDLAEVPISSTKDRHGHAIAAAGAQEFILTGLCMENDFIPCTYNLERPICVDNVQLVQKENINKKINTCLTNNFAFGGVNTVLALRKNG